MSKYMLKRIYRKGISFLPQKAVIYLDFLRAHYRLPNLKDPATYADKIQWIKLYGGLSKYGYLVDKNEVRKYVADKIGDKYLNNVYGVYASVDDIDFDVLPEKFVVKLNNGSGYNYICESKENLDIKKIKRLLDSWLKIDIYKECKEEQYKNIKSKIIIEKYMEDESGELRDYKIFCFEGKAEFIQVDTGRYTNHYQDMYDINWNKQEFTFGYKSSKENLSEPKRLKEMLKCAEKLSQEVPFARVDFYYVDNRIYFGEITLTPQNGMKSFRPKWKDAEISKKIILESYMRKI